MKAHLMTDARKTDQNLERGWLSRQLENAAHRAAEMPAWMTRSKKVSTMTDARKALAELLPCPFCGEKPWFGKEEPQVDALIRCENDNCPAHPEVSLVSDKLTIEGWNTRSPLPGTREEVARVTACDPNDPRPIWEQGRAPPAGTQDREAFRSALDKAYASDIVVALDAWIGEVLARGYASSWHYGELWTRIKPAIVAALPPAPIPEREGMRKALAYIAGGCVSRPWTAETFEEAARRAARAALAPHDKMED